MNDEYIKHFMTILNHLGINYNDITYDDLEEIYTTTSNIDINSLKKIIEKLEYDFDVIEVDNIDNETIGIYYVYRDITFEINGELYEFSLYVYISVDKLFNVNIEHILIKLYLPQVPQEHSTLYIGLHQ